MLQLIKFEFIKFLQKRNLIAFLIILCILNIGIFAYTQNLDSQIPPSSYHQLQTELQTISNDKRYQFIKDKYETYHGFLIIEQLINLRMNEKDNQYIIESILNENPQVEEKYGKLYQENHDPIYTSHLESEVTFLEEILKEFQKLYDYPLYIQNIQDKAKTLSSISIFQKDGSFEQKNNQKTAQDYLARIDTPLIYESEKGVTSALSFPVTSFLIMLSMMVLVSSMILEEKEKKLFAIIKITSQGQYPTMLAKCFVMIIMVGVITTMMMVGQLVYSSVIYGLGDLSRSVQSLSQYSQCPFSLSVQQFIGLFILMKCLAASFIGLIMLLIAILSKNKLFAIIISIVIIIIEYLLYLFIPSLNSLYLFKYFNLISVLQTDSFFQVYRNVSCFKNLISLQMLILIGLLSLFIIFIIIDTFVYHYKRNMNIELVELPQFKNFQSQSLSLIKQESYKIFFIQKVFLLCILCILIQCYQYQHISIYMDNDEKIYQQYMKRLEGPLTNEKEQWILQEQKHYQDLNQQLATISKKREQGSLTQTQANAMQEQINEQLRGEQVFQRVFEQYEDIQNNPQKQFVYPVAYQKYFIDTNWLFMPTLLLCIFTIIGLSQVITYEYQNQMHKITQTSYRGNHYILNIKLSLSIGIGMLFLIIVLTPPFVLLQQTYGFSSLLAPAMSIQNFLLFPSWVSIGMICMMSLILKIYVVFIIIIGIFAIGIKVRNHLLTLFMSICLFLLPLLFAYGGYHFIDFISLYPLLFHGQFVSNIEGLLQILFSFIGYGILAVVSLKYIYTHYKSIH